jgi:hypothetical protein
MTLPNLLVAGFPKAGTGSLFSYITQHPDVCGSTRKEVDFFTNEREDGLRAPVTKYAAFFPCEDARYVTEATPRYVYGGTRVICAIQRILREPRIVLILREPFDRLWSAYTFQRSLGHVSSSFEAYVEACERIRRTHPSIHDQRHFKGLSIGMYGDHLPPWLTAFGTDLRVLFFDDLRDYPASVMLDLCGWLGLDGSIVDGIRYERVNPTVHPRSLGAARGAERVRRASRLIVPAPGRALALRAYRRLNAAAPPARPSAEIEQHVRELYRRSNRTVADSLRAAGHDRLPSWLSSTIDGARPRVDER